MRFTSLAQTYLARSLVSIFFYFFFRVTHSGTQDFFYWHGQDTRAATYTFLAIMLCWEFTAWLTGTLGRSRLREANTTDFIRVFIWTMLIEIPLAITLTWFYHEFLKIPDDGESTVVDTVTAIFVSIVIVLVEIIGIYIRNAIRQAQEKEAIQNALVRAEFEELKSQVNPHFLFNNFSVLASLVEKDQKLAVAFIEKLSDIYRYILTHDKKPLVSLEQELNFIDDYLFLVGIRYKEGVRIHYHLPPDIRSIKAIPPLSLQILVENAIKHNAFTQDKPLEILIAQDDNGYLVVENVKHPKPTKVASTKIGLENLAHRIMLSVKKELIVLDLRDRFIVKLPLAAV